jgi:hypothetical protein
VSRNGDLRAAPEGIVVGDAFWSYIRELRESWPHREELARKHGVHRPETGGLT